MTTPLPTNVNATDWTADPDKGAVEHRQWHDALHGATFRPANYGAKHDGRLVKDAVVTNASATVTSTTAAFVAGDVGKVVSVQPNERGNAVIKGTISAVNSATSITVSTVATAAIASGGWLFYGTDDSAAVQSAIDAANTAGGGEVRLPRGTTYANVNIRSFVEFVGQGYGTVLRGLPSATADVIGSVGNPFGFGIRHMRIEGNKQAGATGRGIFLSSLVQPPADANPRLLALTILDTGSHGIELAGDGMREAFLIDFYILRSQGNGLVLGGTDHRVGPGTVGQAFISGITVGGGNMILTAVKSFYSGYDTNADAYRTANNYHGFIVSGTNQQLTGCQSQDNGGHGLLVSAGKSTFTGFVAGGEAYSGFRVEGSDNVLRATLVPGGGQVGGAGPALTLAGTATRNDIDLAVQPGSMATAQVTTTGGATVSGNSLRFKGSDGAIAVAAGTTSYTPEPHLAPTHILPLTTNVSIGSPAESYLGQTLRFVFTQDATGGRTVTFSSTYRTAWTPSTTANLANTIEFVYDGSRWVQTSATVGLTAAAGATVPAQVGTVTATAGAGQVSLAWAAPADGGSSITDYVVQYTTTSGSGYLTFADGTSATTGATVTGLTGGTPYFFRVAAVNAVGTGAYSAEATATPTSGTQTTHAADTFDRADSTTVLGTTTTGAKAWTARYGTWGISTNKAYSPVLSSDAALATIDTGVTDYVVEATISTTAGVSNNSWTFAARYVSDTNYVSAGIDGVNSKFTLLNVRSGSFTLIGTEITGFVAQNGDVMRLTCNGNNYTLVLLRGGTALHTVSGTASPSPNGAPDTTNTIIGIRNGYAGSTSNRWDDFSVKSLP